MNIFGRFVGIVSSPKATFQDVVARPRVFGMLALLTCLSVFGATLPMLTEGGRQSAIDQQVSGMESFGMQVTDEMYEQIQRRASWLPYQTGIGVLISVPVFLLIISGILFAVFNAAMGGDAAFKQVFSIVVHANVIAVVGQLFTGTINYFRQSVSSVTTLTAAMPFIDDSTFFGKFLSLIDLFMIWWVLVLAIGLGVLYRRRTQPIALTLYAVYAVIAVAIAAVMSR